MTAPRPISGSARRPDDRLRSGTVALVTANYLRTGLGAAIALVVAAGLGAEPFGRWVFVTAWVGLLVAAVDLGLGELVTREGAARPEVARSLLATTIRCRLALLAPSGLAVLVWSETLAFDAETAGALRLGCGVAATAAAYSAVAAVLRAQEAFLTLLWLDLLGLAAQLGAFVVLMRAGQGVVALVAAVLVVQVGQLLAVVGLVRRLPSPAPTPATPTDARAPAVLRRALPFAGAALVATIQVRLPPLLLGYLRGPADVGWFAAAWRMAELVRLVPQGIFGAALPVLASELGRDRRSALHLRTSLERTTLVTAVTAAALLALGGPVLLRTAFGATFEPAAPVLMVLAAGLVPMLENAARRVYLLAVDRPWVAAGWSAAGLAAQATAAVPLIAAFGSTGAALAVALAEAVIWLPLRQAVGRMTGEADGTTVVARTTRWASRGAPPPTATTRSRRGAGAAR